MLGWDWRGSEMSEMVCVYSRGCLAWGNKLRISVLGARCCVQAALRARESGSTRFCMGAAWRGPSQVGQRQWDRVLEMVKQIR